MFKTLPVLAPERKNRFEKEAAALAQAAKEAGIEVMAVHLKKSPATIRSELVMSRSPESPHKTGFDDGLSYMFMSGDFTPLHIFLDRFDLMIVPREGNPELAGQSREQMSFEVLAANGELTRLLAEALADGYIEPAEWAMISPMLKQLERSLAAANRQNGGAAVN